MRAKPATRLHVAADLGDGARIALAPEPAHRLRAVLRLAAGDHVALFNGRDGEWLARIDALERGAGVAIATERLRAQPADDGPWLVFALIKRARLEWLIEKGTEIGAAALVPVVTQRTVAERINRDRLGAIAREAAEQSERLTVPEIRAPQPLQLLLDSWPPGRRLVLCDEGGTAPPVGDAMARLPPGPLAVLIGPEGGFAETELDALKKLPFVFPVGLGPRVLRSETAALAALVLAQALGGDWSGARRRPHGTADAP